MRSEPLFVLGALRALILVYMTGMLPSIVWRAFSLVPGSRIQKYLMAISMYYEIQSLLVSRKYFLALTLSTGTPSPLKLQIPAITFPCLLPLAASFSQRRAALVRLRRWPWLPMQQLSASWMVASMVQSSKQSVSSMKWCSTSSLSGSFLRLQSSSSRLSWMWQTCRKEQESTQVSRTTERQQASALVQFLEVPRRFLFMQAKTREAGWKPRAADMKRADSALQRWDCWRYLRRACCWGVRAGLAQILASNNLSGTSLYCSRMPRRQQASAFSQCSAAMRRQQQEARQLLGVWYWRSWGSSWLGRKLQRYILPRRSRQADWLRATLVMLRALGWAEPSGGRWQNSRK